MLSQDESKEQKTEQTAQLKKEQSAAVSAEVRNKEFSVNYRTGSSASAVAFLYALSPVWFLWSLVACLNLLVSAAGNVAIHPGDAVSYLAGAFFYGGLIALGIFALKICRHTKLAFSAEQLSLPPRFLFEAKGRLRRDWSNLAEVDFRDENGQAKNPRTVTLVFGDGAIIPLSIAALGRDGLRELVLTVETLGERVKCLPPLSKLDLDLSTRRPGRAVSALHASYTHLWEDELSSRFGSTIFVPLVAGDALQDGRLKIDGQLAFGGLSAVYIAHYGDGAPVVVKESVLPAGVHDQLREKAHEMFRREAEILSALEHPRIARVLDFFQERGRNYLVLSYIEGVDLRRFVREQGAQKPIVVKRWLKEMASLLAYLHGHSPPVVHRDVSPDNIVLAYDGKLSLIDFGASNLFVGTATGTLVGKQSYISPEQFRGKAKLASDIYSLGCTMAFVLTGKDPEPLSRCDLQSDSLGLAGLISLMTEQDEHKRPASCQELLKLIDELPEEQRLG